MRRKVLCLYVTILSISLASPITICAQDQSAVPKSPRELRQSPGTQIVVVEGAGTSVDEARRDAFHEAVRQVVGMFVDAQTQIKNDELIEDRILTYSNAYVKTYQELGQSSRGGLVRYKISALVQQTKLVEKLKAENISMKDVDGKGLFAQAITQMETSQAGSDLLTAALEGFPESLVTANVTKAVRNVQTDADGVTIEIDVDVEVNMDAYLSFAKRLDERLREVAKDSGGFTSVLSEQELAGKKYFWTGHNHLANWMPKSFKRSSLDYYQDDLATVAVSLSRSSSGDRMDSRYYRIDKKLVTPLTKAVSNPTYCKLQFLDGQGNDVAVERFELRWQIAPQYAGTFPAVPVSVYAFNPNYSSHRLIHAMPAVHDYPSSVYDASHYSLFWFHPQFALDSKLVPRMTITRRLKLSLDEIKSVAKVKCEVYRD
jgi:hypothetical protein